MTLFKAVLIRAVKTVCQTAVGMLSGSAVGLLEADWVAVLSVSSMAGVVSILSNIAGLPEVKSQ